MGNAIVITSGKGGTGKTTCAAALSAHTALLGYKTLCLDADVVLKNLDLHLGLGDHSARDFLDVIRGYCSLDEALIAHPRIKGLHFLPSPAEQPSFIGEDEMSALVCEAKAFYDYVFVDSPAGLGSGFRLASQGADMAIIVSTTDFSCYRDAARTVLELEELGIINSRLIVNRVRPSLLGKLGTNIDDAVDFTGVQLLGLVPEDKAVILASNSGVPLPLFSSGRASRAFERISRRLCGQKIKLKRI